MVTTRMTQKRLQDPAAMPKSDEMTRQPQT
jgi:hypothetical protein